MSSAEVATIENPVHERVEKLLCEILESKQLVFDGDGDVPIRWGSALFYVRVLDGTPPLVRVFSPMLRDVKSSRKLLVAINEINAQIVSGRVFVLGTDVMVATEIVASHLDRPELEHAVNAIGTIADTFDDDLQLVFGGHRGLD